MPPTRQPHTVKVPVYYRLRPLEYETAPASALTLDEGLATTPHAWSDDRCMTVPVCLFPSHLPRPWSVSIGWI